MWIVGRELLQCSGTRRSRCGGVDERLAVVEYELACRGGVNSMEAVKRDATEEIDIARRANMCRLSRAVCDVTRGARDGQCRVLTVLSSLQTWRGNDGACGRVGGEWWWRIRCDMLELGRYERACIGVRGEANISKLNKPSNKTPLPTILIDLLLLSVPSSGLIAASLAS